jgi:hypothetical protein
VSSLDLSDDFVILSAENKISFGDVHVIHSRDPGLEFALKRQCGLADQDVLPTITDAGGHCSLSARLRWKLRFQYRPHE